MIALLFFALLSTASIYTHNITNLSYSDTDLYPIQKPYNQGYLAVNEEHQIFFEEFGNPNGIPVLVVHGGPGAGCEKSTSQIFNPHYYRIIMFDQRGAMRSLPFAQMHDNTPQDSVHDMECLRKYLKIDKWILFGGSYGSLLSILYGETHPDRVLYFILRGIFLGRKQEYENLFYGMGKFFPEAYHNMLSLFSNEEQSNLIASMDKRVMSADSNDHLPASHAFMYYDLLCAQLCPDFEHVEKTLDKKFALSVARSFIHYAANNFFLKESNQLLNNIATIQDIPAIIIQGRYDLICPPQNAYDLHISWPKSELWFITNAGHSAHEPSISQALKNAMDRLMQ